MKGVLLHGGLGTRLRPLTHTGPKQLIKVAGKPVSQWCIEDILSAGIKDIAIILGELAPERVIEFYGDGSWLSARITYIYQGYPYGLAHAVYLAREFVGDEPFVVYLGDNILAEGISSHVKRFLESDADAMVLLAQVPNPQRFGVAQFDDRGRLVKLVEKPREPPSNFALVGIYFFRPPHIFRAIETLRPSWRGELEITDAIQKLIDWGLKVEYAIVSGWWKDTGTPEDILEVNRLLLDHRIAQSRIDGYVDAGARIEGRVVIEEGARIEAGALVRGPAYIGKGTIVGKGTYIGPYTSVGDNCTIRGVEIENSVIMDGVEIEVEGARIVDSLVGSHVSIKRCVGIPRAYRFIVGECARIELMR